MVFLLSLTQHAHTNNCLAPTRFCTSSNFCEAQHTPTTVVSQLFVFLAPRLARHVISVSSASEAPSRTVAEGRVAEILRASAMVLACDYQVLAIMLTKSAKYKNLDPRRSVSTELKQPVFENVSTV